MEETKQPLHQSLHAVATALASGEVKIALPIQYLCCEPNPAKHGLKTYYPARKLAAAIRRAAQELDENSDSAPV